MYYVRGDGRRLDRWIDAFFKVSARPFLANSPTQKGCFLGLTRHYGRPQWPRRRGWGSTAHDRSHMMEVNALGPSLTASYSLPLYRLPHQSEPFGRPHPGEAKGGPKRPPKCPYCQPLFIVMGPLPKIGGRSSLTYPRIEYVGMKKRHPRTCVWECRNQK